MTLRSCSMVTRRRSRAQEGHAGGHAGSGSDQAAHPRRGPPRVLRERHRGRARRRDRGTRQGEQADALLLLRIEGGVVPGDPAPPRRREHGRAPGRRRRRTPAAGAELRRDGPGAGLRAPARVGSARGRQRPSRQRADPPRVLQGLDRGGGGGATRRQRPGRPRCRAARPRGAVPGDRPAPAAADHAPGDGLRAHGPAATRAPARVPRHPRRANRHRRARRPAPHAEGGGPSTRTGVNGGRYSNTG